MRGWFRIGQTFMGRFTAPRRTRYARLGVEILEDRCLLSGGFVQTNLVSDLPGLARVTDPNLVNPWGLSAGPTGPFWVSNNGAGVSTLYDGQGQPSPLVVNIPGATGNLDSIGTPTGTAFNAGPGFIVSANGQSGSSQFLFATEDGFIAGWNPNVDSAHALVAVDNSSVGANYKGLALGTDSTGRTLLYATNFSSGAVDVFDSTFQAVSRAGLFNDPNLPIGFAPFGIQNVNGDLYVTYAKQDAEKYDDVAGGGNGFIDVFNGDGVLQQRLVSQGPLNSPWGLALAPASFGEFGHDLLVGNFGDGRINVFDPSNGRFLGQLEDGQGNPLAIDHLWGLEFGNGAGAGNTDTLYYNAEIDNQQHGLFGQLRSTQAAADGTSKNELLGNIYNTPTSEATEDGSVDDYPLPPTGAPATRGDIEIQPRTLPSLFPLRATTSDLAPALLTISAGPTSSPVTASPGVLGTANSSGNGSIVVAAPAAPGQTFNVGAGAANPAAGQEDPMPASRPGALAMLLSLRSQPDVVEKMPTTPDPSNGGKSLAAATSPTGANGDPRLPSPSEGDGLALAAWIVSADRLIGNAAQNQEPQSDTPMQDNGSERATGSMVRVHHAEHECALVTMDSLTFLIVAGAAGILLGVGHAALGMYRREHQNLAPTIQRKQLIPGQ